MQNEEVDPMYSYYLDRIERERYRLEIADYWYARLAIPTAIAPDWQHAKTAVARLERADMDPVWDYYRGLLPTELLTFAADRPDGDEPLLAAVRSSIAEHLALLEQAISTNDRYVHSFQAHNLTIYLCLTPQDESGPFELPHAWRQLMRLNILRAAGFDW